LHRPFLMLFVWFIIIGVLCYCWQPSRCMNQIDEACKDIEKTINLTVQNTLNTLERDCDHIAQLIDTKLAMDRFAVHLTCILFLPLHFDLPTDLYIRTKKLSVLVFIVAYCCHCSLSMWSRVYVTVGCPSVCPIYRPLQLHVVGLLLGTPLAGYWSIAAGTQQ